MYYTYLVGWRKLDRWYYGYRGALYPDCDLWIKYFTSSKYVHQFRETNGEPDVIRVHKTFISKHDAIEFEAKFLTRVKAVRSDRWINRAVKGEKFRSPDRFSEKSRQKMRESRLRNGATRKKPWSDSEIERARLQLRKINESGLYRRKTEAHRKNLSVSMMGNMSRKGAKNSEDHNRKIAQTHRESALTRVSCVQCHEETSRYNLTKHVNKNHPMNQSIGS